MKRSPRTCSRFDRHLQCAALFAALCLPLLAQTGGSGGQAAGVRIKAESRLVLVDAVVTDKKDEPVTGLSKDDFRVLEDGKPQAIVGFQTHTGAPMPGISQQQHFLLLFDGRPDRGETGDDAKWIEQAAAKFAADNAGPNRLMSVAYYTPGCMTIGVQFTADVGQLQRALTVWPDLSRCGHVRDPYGDIRSQNYSQLAKDLAHVPGHKVVALFAAHVPRQPSATASRPAPPPRIRSQVNQRPSQRSSRLERNAGSLTDPKGMQLEFRKADVSVYPVEGQVGARTPAWALSLADATGGHELNRGNDVVAVFNVLAREQDESYTLAYVPKDSPEGSCHALKVTVARPDVKARGRNLYCNISAPSLASANPTEVELESLAASPQTGSIAGTALAPFFYEAGGTARVNLALDIPAPVLDPVEANGKIHADMDVVGLAYNLGGQVAARFSDTVSFDFGGRPQFDAFLRQPLHYEHQFEIAPGNYTLKVVFRSGKDRFGVAETQLAVEAPDSAQLALSAIALSRDVQPISPEAFQEELDKGAKPLVFRGNRIRPSGSDLLSRAAVAEAYFEIYEPPAAGRDSVQLTMHLRLLDVRSNEEKWDSGDVDLSALAAPGNRAIPVALRLPVANLPPGAYRAELTVKDSEGEAARSVQFRTE